MYRNLEHLVYNLLFNKYVFNGTLPAPTAYDYTQDSTSKVESYALLKPEFSFELKNNSFSEYKYLCGMYQYVMTSFSFYFPHRAKSTGTYALLPCSFCIVFRMPTKLFDEFSNEI